MVHSYTRTVIMKDGQRFVTHLDWSQEDVIEITGGSGDRDDLLRLINTLNRISLNANSPIVIYTAEPI